MRQEQLVRAAFGFYLRTGLRIVAPAVQPVEHKYNPWHDPDDGRFTFAGNGIHVPRGYGGGGAGDDRPPRRSPASKRPEQSAGTGGRRIDRPSMPRGESPSQSAAGRVSEFAPQHPRNHSIYVVRAGDTLTSIAKSRVGLTVDDLAWLNKRDVNAVLPVGTKLMVPHQTYLDAGRRARQNFLALSLYMERHGGALPPDVAHAPTVESQVAEIRKEIERANAALDAAKRQNQTPRLKQGVPLLSHKIDASGFRLGQDKISRTWLLEGSLKSVKDGKRSRSMQLNAGKPDRRDGLDEGGHFIAPDFGGPPENFNHFAQDRNFNRGQYRVMEKEWRDALRQTERFS